MSAFIFLPYQRGDLLLFRPTKALNSILDITPEMLHEMGISALFLDVDNTLTTHNNPTPIEGLTDWLDGMRAAGIKMMIVSNNHAPRVAPFAEKLGLDFTAEGAKPLPKGFSAARKKLNVPKKNICAVGDQIFTDILGANLFGIRSIFVFPIEPETSLPFRFKRAVEKPLLPKRP